MLVDSSPTMNEKDVGGLTPAAKYGKFQDSLYAAGLLRNKLPVVTTDSKKLEAQARAALEEGPFNYVAGGAGEGATIEANRLAFRQWRIIPRMLRPVTERDMRIELFGEKYGMLYSHLHANVVNVIGHEADSVSICGRYPHSHGTRRRTGHLSLRRRDWGC
jgi:hypothetical protein